MHPLNRLTEKPSPAWILRSPGRLTTLSAAPPHSECPDFYRFLAAQNLFPELRMVLALQFALYSNEQKKGSRTFGI
ncbi:hypothetical protein [Rhizobium sp. NXC14]|uniref:hypothetical protein n=1 Tax=Rhizobium sp. NXC14 TaxID=1981173 RepID=UPI0012F4B24F|nr:hypothetical protein [Rhizobium sp. NXC14]